MLLGLEKCLTDLVGASAVVVINRRIAGLLIAGFFKCALDAVFRPFAFRDHRSYWGCRGIGHCRYHLSFSTREVVRLVRASFGLGLIAGPIIGGFAGEISPHSPFFIAALLNIVAFLVVMFWFRETKIHVIIQIPK